MLANQDNLLWFGEQCGFRNSAHVAQSSKDEYNSLRYVSNAVIKNLYQRSTVFKTE